MGFLTVAVYTPEDHNSLYVRMADESISIGIPKNYLSISSIIDAVKKTGAEAVHPGYGFLSENVQFATRLKENGIVFIGPNEGAMKNMGDKILSKEIAERADVSYIPGFNGAVKDLDHAIAISEEIGYPVIVKASAGGGGKGQRVCQNKDDLVDFFPVVISEAEASFKDNRILIEKYIENPRHIEIQILGDKHGNIIYLPERECSIQRRNQKIIEESPSTFVDEDLRRKMGEQAVRMAKSVGYDSAGTCEFLVDENKNFYFLEMNTRLQVEHPITELVTKLDIVQEMINVANGKELSIKQSDVKIHCVAIESRIYAENPTTFIPSVGQLTKYVEPPIVDGVRLDTGVVQGNHISLYFDPMLCKLITFGTSRDECINKMNSSLDQFLIKGVQHNIPLLRDIFSGSEFLQGNTNTSFLKTVYPNGFIKYNLKEEEKMQLMVIAVIIKQKLLEWKSLWTPTQVEGVDLVSPQYATEKTPEEVKYHVSIDQSSPSLVTLRSAQGKTRGIISSYMVEIELDWKRNETFVRPKIYLTKYTKEIGVCKRKAETTVHEPIFQYHPRSSGFSLTAYGSTFSMAVKTPIQQALCPVEKSKSAIVIHEVQSPMPGTIISIRVHKGLFLKKNEEICVMEAMKMQNVIRSPQDGFIKQVHVSKGDRVQVDQPLITFVK